MRAAAIVVMLGVAAAPAGAEAAKKVVKKSCYMVLDATNDAKLVAVEDPSGAVDLSSADLATGKRTVAVAIRLRSLEADPMTTVGVRYVASFLVNKTGYWVSYRRGLSSSEIAEYGTSDSSFSKGAASSKVDVITGTVTITVDRKVVTGINRATLKNLRVTAYRAVLVGDTGAISTQVDVAESSLSYVDRAPSCVVTP